MHFVPFRAGRADCRVCGLPLPEKGDIASPPPQLTKGARLDGDAEKVTLKAQSCPELGELGKGGGRVREAAFAEYWPFSRTFLPLHS